MVRGLLASLALLLASGPAAAQTPYVQHAAGKNVGGGSVSATFPAAPRAGNTGVAAFFTNDSTVMVPTGWTEVLRVYNAAEDDTLVVAMRAFGAGEPSSTLF